MTLKKLANEKSLLTNGKIYSGLSLANYFFYVIINPTLLLGSEYKPSYLTLSTNKKDINSKKKFLITLTSKLYAKILNTLN